jgi:hypothetical protein
MTLIEKRWFAAVVAVIAVVLAATLINWGEDNTDIAVRGPQILIPSAAPGVRFRRLQIGESHASVRITNIQIVDFDGDGINDLIVCDAARNSVLWYRQDPLGTWTEEVLADELKAPAHATVVDIDQDGDRDVVVAVLGDLFPSDKLIGSVVLLERQSDGSFSRHILLDDVRRVADVQPGDFDGDGDLDLAVAVFGYARGELLWLENRGPREFRDHQLLFRPGIIHAPVGDLDGDGDLDIAAIVSQEEEELWVFDNQGGGTIRRQRIYATNNADVGSAGLIMSDLDSDGDLDLLLPQGDNLEDVYAWPQPYHGCLWIKNQGDWRFEVQRIAHFGGAYAAAVGDIDGDGDSDVTLVSMANDWGNRQQPSVVWLENRDQQFHMWGVDTDPIRLATVACGDLNGDGRADIVSGSLHFPPLGAVRLQRITVWISEEAGPP